MKPFDRPRCIERINQAQHMLFSSRCLDEAAYWLRIWRARVGVYDFAESAETAKKVLPSGK